MADGDPLGLRFLSKPATTLIEKIADGVGVLWEPQRIKRIADATAYVRKVEAKTDAELLEYRTQLRVSHEQQVQQGNMEAVTRLAIPLVKPSAKPEDIDPDWLVYFFSQSRMFSDEEMQQLWAKILAEEANEPGLFSKRTIALLSTMDKEDALLFKNFCRYVWLIDATHAALIYDYHDQVYEKHGIDYPSLMHLANIGLIRLEFPDSLIVRELVHPLTVQYAGESYILSLNSGDPISKIDVGGVSLTSTGVELLNVCGPDYDSEFFDYVKKRWAEREGMQISKPQTNALKLTDSSQSR